MKFLKSPPKSETVVLDSDLKKKLEKVTAPFDGNFPSIELRNAFAVSRKIEIAGHQVEVFRGLFCNWGLFFGFTVLDKGPHISDLVYRGNVDIEESLKFPGLFAIDLTPALDGIQLDMYTEAGRAQLVNLLIQSSEFSFQTKDGIDVAVR